MLRNWRNSQAFFRSEFAFVELKPVWLHHSTLFVNFNDNFKIMWWWSVWFRTPAGWKSLCQAWSLSQSMVCLWLLKSYLDIQRAGRNGKAISLLITLVIFRKYWNSSCKQEWSLSESILNTVLRFNCIFVTAQHMLQATEFHKQGSKENSFFVTHCL